MDWHVRLLLPRGVGDIGRDEVLVSSVEVFQDVIVVVRDV
jgi:hypothetical protein